MRYRKSVIIGILLLFVNSVFAQKEPKIGVVLSGGGAKGYAHIGVLEVLEEAGIKIDYIGGTSMGAIIGGLYASGYSAKQLRKLIKNIDINQAIFEEINREQRPFFSKIHEEKYFLTLAFDDLKLELPKAISKGQGTMNIITEYLSHVHAVENFDNLAIPFLCIATDIESGDQKIFREGYLPQVIMASGAYPTLFAPIKIGDHYYVDGGVVNNMPVQEVIDMGADYIIGVDLGAGLMDYEELENATSIITQIISFKIDAKTAEQRKLVDLLIVPDVKEISVTSFELKDSIIQEGYKSAMNLKPIIDSISRLQNTKFIKEPLEIDSSFVIQDINIQGLENYSTGYVLGKLKIEQGSMVSYDDVINGITALYSTENFEQISHKLEDINGTAKVLNLKIVENSSQYFMRFGLHYDYLLKSALLANFTAKNLLTINSTLSVDAIVGDNPRFNLNYFVDNGIRPSFGFNSSYIRFDLEKLVFVDENSEDLSYNYIFQNFVNQLYMQSTLAEKYAAGIGMEYNYLKIYTKNVEPSNPLRNIQDKGFWNPYAYIRADSRDNSFFPKKGFYIDSEFKYFAGPKDDDFESSSMLKAYMEYNKTVVGNLSVQLNTFIGLSFDKKLPVGFNYLIGGLNEHKIANTFNFYGVRFAHFSGRNLLGVGASMQYNFLHNHFVRYNFNAAYLDNDFIISDEFNFDYTGHGLTYGYLSPLGPIQGILTYSPNYRKLVPYISFGYWF